MSPDAVFITIITALPLTTLSNLTRLLETLEDTEKLEPTNWGKDERSRNPYNRKEMVEYMSTEEQIYYYAGFARRKPIRYTAYFIGEEDLVNITFDFGKGLSKLDIKRVFDLGEKLAEVLKPELGFVHIAWRKLDNNEGFYSASNVISVEKLQTCGLRQPVAYTWYGPHITNLIGKDRLLQCGAVVKETSWGGVQLRLVENPWESDFKTLSTKQKEVLEKLEPSEAFGDYTEWHGCKPGKNWQPIPESTYQPSAQKLKFSHTKIKKDPQIEKLLQHRNEKTVAQDINITEMNLEKVDLTELHANHLMARHAHCVYALFTDTKIFEVDFTGADLTGTHFGNAYISMGSFDRAVLKDISFEYADISDCTFINADLTGSDFSNTKLSRVDFTGANIKGVNWKNAILTKVTFDEGVDVET